MKKALLTVIGFLSLSVGGIGLIFPVLPTTPFVICAAACFGAASPTLCRKLEKSKYFGEYIKNYRSKTGISSRARVTGLIFLWSTLLVSSLIFRKPMVWLILGLVGIAVSLHILTIRKSAGEREQL